MGHRLQAMRLRGFTETEVSNFIKDLHQMVLGQFQKYVIGIKPRLNERGTWLTKTNVNMCFRNEANLPAVLGLLEIIKSSGGS